MILKQIQELRLNKMKIAILGTGAYGIALSNMAIKNNCDITMWTKLEEEYEVLRSKRCNTFVLPDFIIDERINFTTDMANAIKDAELIILSVPIKFMESTVTEMSKYYQKKQHICIASKGIIQDSCLFPYDVAKNILNTDKIGVISGGTFAVDMIKDVPMGLTVASNNNETSKIIRKGLENNFLKFEISNDVLGIEIWGSIKNIVAIGCGIIDGMKYPISTRSMFFTKCYNDIIDLVCDFGGCNDSSSTYSGIGDMFLTCTSSKSRNYTFGNLIGEGNPKDVIDNYISNTTIEGLYALKSYYDLMIKNNTKAEIIEIMYQIVYENMEPNKLMDYLTK